MVQLLAILLKRRLKIDKEQHKPELTFQNIGNKDAKH